MLTGLSKALRCSLATVFAGLYALCVLLPATALAYNDANCLTEQHGFLQAHAHASGGAHQHAGTHEHAAHEHADHQHPHDAGHGPLAAPDGGNEAQPPAAKCCGLAFFAAVAPELGFTPAAPVLAGRYGFAIKPALASLPPEQLIRPPNSLS